MISKPFSVALMVLASFVLSSAAGATTCSNASLSGTYGLLHGGTDAAGQPTIAVSQLTFDSTTGVYTGEDTASHNGVITTVPITATYVVHSNCTGRATVTLDGRSTNLDFVVTARGFLNINLTTGVTAEGFAVKQGSPICSNAGVEGSFAFATTGVLVRGAVTEPVAFIGELKLAVNPSEEGVITGHVAGGEDGTNLAFAEQPVTGSYKVESDCRGRATIMSTGRPEMHFSFVVVDDGKVLLAVETDADSVVSGTLQR